MFFLDLLVYIDVMKRRQLPQRDRLFLRVAYVARRSTYGGTLVP
jgi:hypothetical protein